MIRRDSVIDEVFARDGIAFPSVINAAHVEMMDDSSWRLYMEKEAGGLPESPGDRVLQKRLELH